MTALELWSAAGFQVVPVAPWDAQGVPPSRRGKIPAVQNGDGRWHGLQHWQDGAKLTLDDLRAQGLAGANVGVLTTRHPAVDIDVSQNPEIADAIEAVLAERLGAAPVRFRKNASSRAVLYQLAGVPFKKRALAFTTPDGARCKVEILADGQQIVVAGIHSSGARIEWRDALPDAASLPALDDSGAVDVLHAIQARLAALGCSEFRRTPAEPATPAARARDATELASAQSALAAIDPDVAHDTWVKMGMALKAGLGDAGFALWDKWSARGRKYQPGECRKRWDSFNRSGVTLGTLYHHAAAVGWTRPVAPNDDIKGADVPTVRCFLREEATIDGLPTLRFWRGAFYAWRSGVWCEVTRPDLDRRIIDWFEKRGQIAKVNAPMLKNFERLLESQVALPDETEDGAWIAATPPPAPTEELIAVRNGLLEVSATGRHLHPHTPAFFNVTARPFDFDEGATCPTWRKCVDDWFGGDRETAQVLQEAAGYTVSGDMSQEKAFVVLGPARSGKGVIADVLTALVGAAYTASPDLQSLGGERFGLETLIGKRLATLRDARRGKSDDPSKAAENILRIVGQDRVSVRRKGTRDWTGKLRAILWIFSNTVPRFHDASSVVVSRLIVLRMTVSFLGKEDTTLKARILNEMPGIFLWALEGLDRLRKRGRGFVQPVSGASDVELLTSGTTGLHDFLEEIGAVFKNGASAKIDDAYLRWGAFCTANGHEKGSKTNFVTALVSYATGRGHRLTRRRLGERADRHWIVEGVELLPWEPHYVRKVKGQT
jgi:putative DNA primase/helicase